jgi:hypothetical protein
MAAQGLVAGIRQGCEFLREGKAQISEVKKAIGEVKAFANEAKGVWAELQSLWALVAGLFSGSKNPKSETQTVLPSMGETQPVAKPKREPQRELSYEEFQAQAIHQICEQLKQFFEIKRQLTEHCNRLEEESKTTTDIEGAALDRIQIEMQMEMMTVQIREAMIYTPKEIGLADIYGRFLKMYNQILEERAFDRELKAKRARDEKWQREYRNDLLKAKLGYAVVVAIAGLWMMGLFSVL